ncbi:hypothetical protein AVEN_221653-1 [Araneus ventricosus]|uniref:Uncharacterized protein n=1 Tax=Araneus ventricosus TaxID=182803 RepID=A0A4Y2T0F9_ARAVE|nr:hypothetical protein AVEN_221653-1 [Araneus ventricosus]
MLLDFPFSTRNKVYKFFGNKTTFNIHNVTTSTTPTHTAKPRENEQRSPLSRLLITGPPSRTAHNWTTPIHLTLAQLLATREGGPVVSTTRGPRIQPNHAKTNNALRSPDCS